MESLDRIIYPHTTLTVSSKTDYFKIFVLDNNDTIIVFYRNSVLKFHRCKIILYCNYIMNVELTNTKSPETTTRQAAERQAAAARQVEERQAAAARQVEERQAAAARQVEERQAAAQQAEARQVAFLQQQYRNHHVAIAPLENAIANLHKARNDVASHGLSARTQYPKLHSKFWKQGTSVGMSRGI